MCVPCRDGLLCPWAAARPQSTAHDLPGSAWSLCVPVGGGPPARSPHASLKARSGRSRGTPWSCRHPPAPRPCPPPPTHTTARPPAPPVSSTLVATVSWHVVRRPPNFACNSPPVVCSFVSVHTVTSLVFLNCMRFCLALTLTPMRAQHPGSAVPPAPSAPAEAGPHQFRT